MNICSFIPLRTLSVPSINDRFKLIQKDLCYLMGAAATSLISTANSGLSVSGTTAVLGQTIGQSGDPAALGGNREIPMGSNSLVFTGTGKIGIGTNAPTLTLEVNGAASVSDRGYPSSGLGSNLPARFYVGHGGSNWGLSIVRADVGNGAANLSFYKTRNADASVRTGVIAGDNIASMGFFAPTADGSIVANTARYRVVVTGTPTNTYVPVYMEWGTTNTSGTYAERMRLSSEGRLYVGVNAIDATATLHLAAGTATAGTAPLKLTAGTNLTTPENGAFEFDGTNLYFTVGGVRRTVTLV